MARGKLFEYAVLYHPKQTKDQAERNEWPKSQLVVNPTTILAGTEVEVAMIAARSTEMSAHMDHLEDVETIVRPF